MNLPRIFDTFSRRDTPLNNPDEALTDEFRFRLKRLYGEVFNRSGGPSDFWFEINSKLAYLYGRPITRYLNPHLVADGVADGVLEFLDTCCDKQFLDFVEQVFKLDAWNMYGGIPDTLVKDVNLLFGLDDLPYALTDFSWEQFEDFRSGTPPQRPRISAYPQVIRRDSGVLHQTAVEPTLRLLSAPHFVTANKEFLGGLADYRNGDYEDCVTKCLSAFESILKVVCQRKAWAYKETHTADTLLTTVFGKTSLEGFYKEHIKLILTVRNRQSSAHGGGIQPKQVPKHVANYVINATAAATLLLVEEVGL